MSNQFKYTGEEVEAALDGLKAYSLAAGHPRDVVLDMCSEFKTQLAAQRQARPPKPPRIKKLSAARIRELDREDVLGEGIGCTEG